MNSPFTIAALKKLPPREKPYEVRAVDPKGLLLRVQPSGSKTFYYEHSRGKREKLGKDGRLMLETKTITQIKKLALEAAARGPKETRLDKSKTTLGGFVTNDYSAHIADKVLTHRQHIRTIERNFGHLYEKRMDEILPLDIERWKKKRLKAGVKFETIKRDFACLKACLNTALSPFRYINAHQLISYRLEAPTNLGDEQPKKPRFLSSKEETALRESLDRRENQLRASRIRGNYWRKERGYKELPVASGFEDHVKPIVLLALNTGLRRGDLFALEWKHIDFQARHISLVIRKTRRKKSKHVVLPLSDEAIEVLTVWRGQVDSELVFPSPITGAKLDNIDTAWKAVLKEAAIANFRFHDLRHTFATRLIEAGADVYTVKDLMTHSSVAQTEIYAHISSDRKRDAVDRLNASRIKLG